MTSERVAAWLGAAVVVFGAGVAWDSLSSRIDKVDAKIVEIQKTLGSTPCSAILTRQLAAIDKSRADVRKSLDGLSNEYGCVTAQNNWSPTTLDVTMNASAARLGARLKAVDAVLAKKK
jgi:hypothetical protein